MFIGRFLRKNKLLSGLTAIIVSLISVLRKHNKANRLSGRTTIVLCFHKLGDSVFTIPALRALRDNLKQDFYIFCYEETKPIYELFFKSEYLIEISHKDIYLNRFAGKKIRQKVYELRPAEIFDFTGAITSASLLLFISAPKVTGINAEYFKSLYTSFVPIRSSPHILDVYLDIVRQAFPGKNYDEYKIFPVKVEMNGFILIHPFAGWTAKEWEMKKFIELSKFINSEYKVAFVAQKGLMKDDDISELRENKIIIFETKTITELISILKQGSLIVSNDSGPAFIANALGKPTFVIYGPTSPLFHHPYGNHHRYVQKKIICSPINEKFCFTNAGRNGCKSFECMIQLGVEEVYINLMNFISELGIRKKEIVAQDY